MRAVVQRTLTSSVTSEGVETGRTGLGLTVLLGVAQDDDMLVVSQFTLCGDVRPGRRPSITEAAPPELAEALYEKFVSAVSAMGIRTATGRFRTEMVVSLENHGPVTILVDSKKLF